ncbi:hypothetical protein TRVL_09715 [Trypanosoma vivax]|nr:hypothetical protein TRVL_09715 [Trypanosoma vivax]
MPSWCCGAALYFKKRLNRKRRFRLLQKSPRKSANAINTTTAFAFDFPLSGEQPAFLEAKYRQVFSQGAERLGKRRREAGKRFSPRRSRVGGQGWVGFVKGSARKH